MGLPFKGHCFLFSELSCLAPRWWQGILGLQFVSSFAQGKAAPLRQLAGDRTVDLSRIHIVQGRAEKENKFCLLFCPLLPLLFLLFASSPASGTLWASCFTSRSVVGRTSDAYSIHLREKCQGIQRWTDTPGFLLLGF